MQIKSLTILQILSLSFIFASPIYAQNTAERIIQLKYMHLKLIDAFNYIIEQGTNIEDLFNEIEAVRKIQIAAQNQIDDLLENIRAIDVERAEIKARGAGFAADLERQHKKDQKNKLKLIEFFTNIRNEINNQNQVFQLLTMLFYDDKRAYRQLVDSIIRKTSLRNMRYQARVLEFQRQTGDELEHATNILQHPTELEVYYLGQQNNQELVWDEIVDTRGDTQWQYTADLFEWGGRQDMCTTASTISLCLSLIGIWLAFT